MDKRVFAADRAAVDAEIDRMKPLVELGGYIPCPDHRIPLEAEWDLVRHYCDRMKKNFRAISARANALKSRWVLLIQGAQASRL